MITLKLKIKEVEFELTHVEALKLYNELSLFFNWQPTSVAPQYPIVNYGGVSNPEIPIDNWERPANSAYSANIGSASGTTEHKI